MKSIYQGLLKGQVTFVVNGEVHNLSAKTAAPINQLEVVKAFIHYHLEVFNGQIDDKIDIDAFFQEFSEEEKIYTPESLLRPHAEGFINQLTHDLKSLLTIDNLSFYHSEEISQYYADQIAIFNQQIQFFYPNFPASSPQTPLSIKQLIGLIRIGLQLEGVMRFDDGIDEKISMFSAVAQALPEKDSPVWEQNDLTKQQIIQAYLQIGNGFFSQHTFNVLDETDQMRQVQVESSIAMIAQKLGVDAYKIQVDMDAKGDPATAARIQQQEIERKRREDDEASQDLIAEMRARGEIA